MFKVSIQEWVKFKIQIWVQEWVNYLKIIHFPLKQKDMLNQDLVESDQEAHFDHQNLKDQ